MGEGAVGSTDAPEGRWIVRATWLFLVLGIAIRLVRYLVDYPIWHDEAFVAVNLWDRSYTDLLRPLDFGQVAPWFFLAIERTAVLWLGYSELSLRLFPTVCSVLSVPLFFHLSGRVLNGSPRLLAMAVFATSVYPVRHGAEIKPYASDLLAALILLSLAVECHRSSRPGRWWSLLAATVPFWIAVSYPAVFVAGGLSLALAPSALRSPRRARLPFLIYNVMVLASFLAVYLGSTVFQAEKMREFYRNGYWAESFPPLDRPWLVPLWLLDVHAGTMMAYPAGDRHGGSILTLACVIAGIIGFRREGKQRLLAVLLVPAALGLLAAFLGRYPYGGAPRIMLYLAPSICLLAGAGASRWLARLPRPALRHGLMCTCVAGLGLLAAGLMIRDLARPYRVVDDLRSREFARWFWGGGAGRGPFVCLGSDLGLTFDREVWDVGMSAVYLFHQRRYSPEHQRPLPIDLSPDGYSTNRPLKIVAFHDVPDQYPAFARWLTTLERSFRLQGRESYIVHPGKPGEPWLRDAYVILELVPRDNAATRTAGKGEAAAGRRF
jgi:hypothetical protein